MIGTHRDRQLLAGELQPLEFRRRLRFEREGDIDRPIGQHLGHPLGRAFAQPDLDAGKRRGEAREDRGNVQLPAEQHRADVHMTTCQAAELIDLAAQRLGLGEHGAGAGGDQLAGLGRLDRACRAAQQLDPELLFQSPDLMRERGLRDVQLICRIGEVPVADDRLEVAQLPDVHGRYILFRD